MKYYREGRVGAFIRFLFAQVLCFAFVFCLTIILAFPCLHVRFMYTSPSKESLACYNAAQLEREAEKIRDIFFSTCAENSCLMVFAPRLLTVNMYMCTHRYMSMSVCGYIYVCTCVCVYMHTQKAEVDSVSNGSYFQPNT